MTAEEFAKKYAGEFVDMDDITGLRVIGHGWAKLAGPAVFVLATKKQFSTAAPLKEWIGAWSPVLVYPGVLDTDSVAAVMVEYITLPANRRETATVVGHWPHRCKCGAPGLMLFSSFDCSRKCGIGR